MTYVWPTLEQLRRFEAAIDYAESHPYYHDQGVWLRPTMEPPPDGSELLETAVTVRRLDPDAPAEVHPCGTVGCLAGNAVVLAGHRVRFRYGPRNDYYCSEFLAGGEWFDDAHVADVARELLGLDEDQANFLFSADVTIPLMRRALHALSGGVLGDPDVYLNVDEQDTWYFKECTFLRPDGDVPA